MFTQDDIDAVLNQAQTAVDSLARDVTDLAAKPSTAPTPVAEQAAPPAPTGGAPAAFCPPQPSSEARLARIRRLRVPVVVRLAQRHMSVSEVLKIVPGSILEFDQTVDRELDLLVNNHRIGAGVAVKVDEHFGLRVTGIGDVRERIQSLSA